MYIWGACKKYKSRGNIMAYLRLQAIKIVSIDKASSRELYQKVTVLGKKFSERKFSSYQWHTKKMSIIHACVRGHDWNWMKRSDLVEVKNRVRPNIFHGISDRLVRVYQRFLCANVVEACKIINHPKDCVDVKREKWRLDTTRSININV